MAISSFIHRWLPSPAGDVSTSKTLLLLHGTGGDENDLIPLGQSIAPEANLLSLRGRIDENGANRFFARHAEGVFDLESMTRETEALAAFLQAASAAYGYDPEQLFAVGFSNGANMASSLLFQRPDLLRGAFLMRATVPYEPDEPLSLLGIRVLIASGEWDPMVYREDAERLATLLVEGGADVEHLWLQAGHHLTRQELVHARDWLASQPF